MIYIQIGSKSPTSYSALGNGVHGCIKKFHEAGGPTAFSIVGYCTSTAAEFPEITRGSPADLCLHNHLSQFMGDTFNGIRHIHIKAGNGQTSFRTHVCPDGGAQAHPSTFDHLYKSPG